MKDLLLYIARSLVEHPEQVSVTEVVECTAARSEQDRLYAESERLAARMREMDVKSEDLREKLRTTEAAAADAESGAAVVRTQLANNAETLLRLQREIGEIGRAHV